MQNSASFLLLIALISASHSQLPLLFRLPLSSPLINFFVHQFTTQDMATFGSKSALSSLPMLAFVRADIFETP